ncbi:uncharacterized protein N0V96_005963 [Colletotrichum fioriniae]|uniref:uncharacterized protein n=1 Tax=Colletotrichum fioriniae TaxID=710243 RepID=UPI002301845F|nr:uncharacterized protein COL516b_011813 [Colletotrichum fioriniae]KAJ0296282.1 hypothetical protein COL516b_011813 [Colletotrichum fioriniae]KAJ3944432.1 hypothetical protein N0V96_005963 [Colletotrichum fioriniae]
MSQSIQDITVGDILPLDHVLQLADRSKLLAARIQEFKRNDRPRTAEELRILTSTMDEVEQILRPYTVAVLDCILGDVYENILLEQDGTRTGFDEGMDRITRVLRSDPPEMDSGPNDSSHTFSLEETPEIVERFQRLILGFEDLDRLTHQPIHDTLALSEQQVEACIEAGRMKVLMGCVFDGIGSYTRGQLPPRTSTHTVVVTVVRCEGLRRHEGEGPPLLRRQDATVGQERFALPNPLRQDATVGQGTVASSGHSSRNIPRLRR